MADAVAGRVYVPKLYRISARRRPTLDAIVTAFDRAGARTIYSSLSEHPSRAPIYFGVEVSADERFGILCYPFTANRRITRNRPVDENRVQIRYEREEAFHEEHPLGQDLAGIDVTLVLGVHVDADLFIGLDPIAYDPLPMGISIEFKDAEVERANTSGWHVWERQNHTGPRRVATRTADGFETLIAFAPNRLLDYVRFERQASGLALDPALRFKLAERWAEQSTEHPLEKQFDLSAAEILDVISERFRLGVAMRGGVAERHLQRHLERDPTIASVQQIDQDGAPDFDVRTTDGRRLLIECKNVSPRLLASGDMKVEVQKTRSQKQDPAGRFYAADHFDVLAVCLFSVTGVWEFRFCRSDDLVRHATYHDKLAPVQVVAADWPSALGELPESR
jgi:hypothetical protein